MIVYQIPLERYPETYNKKPLMLAAIASQKNYISLYLMSVYGTRNWRNGLRAKVKIWERS